MAAAGLVLHTVAMLRPVKADAVAGTAVTA
jgi:hypothetical protein